jgi:hypothetical protein
MLGRWAHEARSGPALGPLWARSGTDGLACAMVRSAFADGARALTRIGLRPGSGAQPQLQLRPPRKARFSNAHPDDEP